KRRKRLQKTVEAMHQRKILFSAGIWIAMLTTLSAHAQDSTTAISSRLQQKYVATVNRKVMNFNDRVESITNKNLQNLITKEKKMQRMVGKVDSLKAQTLFRYSIDSLKHFQSMITQRTSKYTRLFKGSYFSYLDTLKGSLSFLKKANDATGEVT